MNGVRLGVVGVTGAVGREILSILHERRFPLRELRGFASRKSVGLRLPFGEDKVRVEEASTQALREVDLVLLSAGATLARELGRDLSGRGVLVIDNSQAFRRDQDVPLVVPEINPESLRDHRHLIANPNCSTIVNLMAAFPLHRRFGLRRMVIATYQAASGAGAAGLAELEQSTRCAIDCGVDAPRVFTEPLGFNLIPRVGEMLPDGTTTEEEKMTFESRKILSAPDLEVLTTCVRVAVRRAHSVASVGFFEQEIDPGAAKACLEAAPGVVWDAEPTPRRWAGRDEVAVGRVRSVGFDGRGLAWFAVGDQLRKGAALNAVQIAEMVVSPR